MKFVKLATNIVVSLFLFNFAVARDTRNLTKAEIAQRMAMPELLNTSAHVDLSWFRDHLHLSNHKVFFLGALMSELEKSESFPNDRAALADCCLRSYFRLAEAEQSEVNFESLKNCINILVKRNEFKTLIDLTIKFGPTFVTLLNELDIASFKQLTRDVLESPRRDEFFNIITSLEQICVFNIRFYGFMISSAEISEEHYFEYLLERKNLALAAGGAALAFCLEKLPIDISRIHKTERLLNSVRDSSVQTIITALKDAIRIITAPDDVTSAGLGVDTAALPLEAKFNQAINALNHGKDELARETIAILSDSEIQKLFQAILLSAKSFQPSELKIAVKLYQMVSEEVRRPIHETEEYLRAAVQYLRLDGMQVFSEGDYKFSFTFRATPEQVALGYFEEMTYFAKREGGPSFDLIANLGADLKFTSAEAVEAFVSQDMRSVFPEWTDDSLIISKDTLKLIAGSRRLRAHLSDLGYKIMLRLMDVIEFLNETGIEDIPNMGNLIRETFVMFGMLSKIKETDTFRKLERFTNAKISDIVKTALNLFDRTEISQVDFFKIRNALVYWMQGPERHRLNELPIDVKTLLVKEYPELN